MISANLNSNPKKNGDSSRTPFDRVKTKILSFKGEPDIHGTTLQHTWGTAEVDPNFVYIFIFPFAEPFAPFKQEPAAVPMAEFKHLVLVKFKEDAAVEDILKGMEKLVSEIESVKSFVWGQDIESQEMLRQGFTHAFMMTFNNKEDFTAFLGHPNHVEFSASFSTAIEKALLLDFPAVTVKAPA